MTSSSEDTEITLGTGKLLVLFFVLVAICAGSFSLGYKLGSKSDSALPSAAVNLPASTTGPKPASSASAPASSYKPAEPKSTTPDAAAADGKPATGDTTNPASSGAATSPSTSPSAPPTSTNSADPATTLPVAAYFVQVAAVTKQEDADSLVDALRKKQYPAFVAASAAADKFFRVQVGPFPDIQEAEATRTRLIGDGYNPIVKK
jgi:cell division septation protein DedD